MNALDHLLSQPMLARMGWTLIHFLWQGAAIALLLGIALLLLRRSSASARHNAACAAMALLALLPAVTFAWLRPAVIAREATSNTVLPPGPIAAIHLIGVDTEKTPSVKTSASREPFVASIAACAWVIGIVLISAWRIGGYACLWLLIRRGSGPVDGSIEAVVARLCERMGVRRAVRLLESARVQTPAVVGWLRPMILVPASIMSGLSAAQLEAILAHELAHIRRHDYLVNVLQTAIETLFFYHPAVWWVSAQIREERENCCDDWAVKTCGDRLLYARALAAMEELRLPPAPFALAASGAPLLRRVRRLLGHQPVPVRLGAARPAISMFLVIACIALPMMASQLDAGDRAVSSDPTTRATATSPVQARNSAGATEVRREDLIPPPPIDYRVAANDLISVRIADLLAPGKETTMSRRVSETGVITLPYIGPLKVAGLTEAEVEQAIIAAYKQAGLIAHANVIVTIAEPQGRMFQILGAVDAPGVYPLRSNDTRLMDALATAKLTGQASQILVFRPSPDRAGDSRVIHIPADKLLAGDLHYNIVLYPRDIIRVIGKPNLSNVEPSKTARVDANVYYVYGHVDRPGVYSMNGRHITLRDALAGAAFDLSRPGSQRVTLLRRKSDGTQWMVLNNVLISDLTTGHISDPDVSPGDQVNVIPENPTRRSEGGR